MKKQSIWVLSLMALFVVGVVSAKGSFDAAPCGTILTSYKGVPARSNENYPYGSCGGRSIYGLKYQCVEYVRRFYHLVKGIETREGMTVKAWEWEHAGTYFKNAVDKGLDAFENGGPVSPLPDDILTFQGGPYGHVAIITAVTGAYIEFIEQNFSSTGTGRLAYNPVTHRLADRVVRGATMTVEGWLRPHPDGSSRAAMTDMNGLP